MKAVVYDGPQDVSIREVPDPRPGPGEVVLDVVMTGVCGTDLHIYDGGFLSSWPLIPGHEIVGVVAEVGEGVADLRVGQQVVADNTELCGACFHCRRDEPLYCENFLSHGVNAPGGFAEQVVVLAAKCFPADDLAREVAVMAEPTACAVHGMDVLGLRPGADVLIFGAGPTGLVLSQLLVHGGAARVTVAAPTAYKLEMARGFGVDETVLLDRADLDAGIATLRASTPRGYDVVVDATGARPVIERCLDLPRTGGTVFIYGMADEDATVPLRPYQVFQRELTVKGSFAQTHCFDRSLANLRTGRVRTDGIITHTFGLDQFEAALAALRDDPECLKAAIIP